MGLFSQNFLKGGTGHRLTGLPRYSELLDRDLRRFLLVNLLTLAGLLPFLLGVLAAVLSSSILLLIPACILGGAIAGPALSGMYDAVLRSLRDAPGKCLENYKRAWKQNWRQSILPGILFCVLLGFYLFMLMMFWQAPQLPGFGTLALYLCSLVLFTMFFSLYWPQLVLFEQSGRQTAKNCLLFLLRYFWKTLGCSLLQVLYWGVIVLFLPWSAVLLPLTGLWFILFTANFLLYGTLNEVFRIEEQIAQAFPEQAAFYESDEEWLRRKQSEGKQTEGRTDK
ncbi:MAG: DUF624 domain-containing protein [Lachnospiraceae bacterium]|nr:DUF624 domain-containing protein [Lachnospiraceae bacterium]